jgi:anti-sigma B factor antagonist
MFRDSPLTFDCLAGKAPGTRIFRVTGPLTLGNMFELQTALREDPPPPLTILDLTGVPYMDSAGLGAIVNSHVHCQNQGAVLAVAGVSSRVMELFTMIHAHGVLNLTNSVEEAENLTNPVEAAETDA